MSKYEDEAADYVAGVLRLHEGKKVALRDYKVLGVDIGTGDRTVYGLYRDGELVEAFSTREEAEDWLMRAGISKDLVEWK